MKVYIASKYVEHSDLNVSIYEALTDLGFEVFLPESMNVDAVTEGEMHDVAMRCYREIDECDVIIVVFPIGRSVACEVGYAIKRKIDTGGMPAIVAFRYEPDGEAMYPSYFDAKVDTTGELTAFIEKCQCMQSNMP